MFSMVPYYPIPFSLEQLIRRSATNSFIIRKRLAHTIRKYTCHRGYHNCLLKPHYIESSLARGSSRYPAINSAFNSTLSQKKKGQPSDASFLWRRPSRLQEQSAISPPLTAVPCREAIGNSKVRRDRVEDRHRTRQRSISIHFLWLLAYPRSTHNREAPTVRQCSLCQRSFSR